MSAAGSQSEQYLAFSLNHARELIQNGSAADDVASLGGISEPLAVVFDAAENDLIILGRRDGFGSPVKIDDFVVALRAVFEEETWPLVSIDRNGATAETKTQEVRFEGGIAGTDFGGTLFDADVLLKNVALGRIGVGMWGIRSYFDLYCEQAKSEGAGTTTRSRFWFTRDKEATTLVHSAGACGIGRFRLRVQTHAVTGAGEDGNRGGDAAGAEFATDLSANYDEMGAEFPVLVRVKALFEVLGLASGLRVMHRQYRSVPSEALRYWLKEYGVAKRETPSTYPLIRRENRFEHNGERLQVELEGGIELKALVLELKDGSIEALRDIVVKFRPSGRTLTWAVPLSQCGISWSSDGLTSCESTGSDMMDLPTGDGKRGCTVDGAVRNMSDVLSGKPSPLISPAAVGSFVGAQRSPYRTSTRFEIGGTSPNVGGVLLSGVGKGAGAAGVDLSGGKFSLVVGGENARLAPEMHGKFVTALWAVYFGQTVPGISIDPIYQDPETGAFSDKHMVRYIGRVVNTDLGRVMRETDYLMKKWSVGSERPRIRGFRTPDDYSGRSRTIYSSLSRFWLTPEDMSFQAADDMLLFDGGNMKVKTQVLGYDIGKEPSNPHNEAFARFFSEHYAEIAEEYPVFEELQDYGKLVALARYLKESGVPLLWFLLANKDQVITEDSPGTVDNLAKQSEYWRGVTIQGGVDMSEPGQYVYDDSAVTAVRQAWQKRQSHPERSASMGDVKRRGPSIPFSFDVDDNRYTVVPQHSLTCGKDHRGIRYQTDFCMRAEGYRVSDKTVRELNAELFRYAMRKHLATELKDGTAEQRDSERERVSIECCARARTTVDDLQDRIDALRGKKYASKAACAESWKAVMKGTPVAELDAVFVEQCHFVSNLELVRCFNPARREAGPFGAGWKPMIPYRVKAAGEKTIAFRNVVIPEQMQVYNQITGDEETLLFSTNRYTVAGYVPPGGAAASQWVGLFLLSDTSYRLVDKVGSEFRFDPSGCLTEMALSPEYRVEIEYLREPTDAFTRIPYVVRTVGAEKKWLRGANLPTCVEVVDVVHKTRETFDLTSEKSVLGYAPREADKSRYQFLALMNDASYRLLDKHGNEIDLSSNGVFERLDPGEEDPVVKRISSGGHGIDFAYTIGASGELMIARAELTGEHELPGGVDSVVYEYDDDNRLCAARRERKAAVATVDEFRGGLAGL